MKALLAVMVLLLITFASAEESQPDAVDQATSFITSINPLILIAAGVVLILASSLAKVIGILLLIVGIIVLVLSLF
jgi:hypothetical protein